jgi:hypothetical protein
MLHEELTHKVIGAAYTPMLHKKAAKRVKTIMDKGQS